MAKRDCCSIVRKIVRFIVLKFYKYYYGKLLNNFEKYTFVKFVYLHFRLSRSSW